MFELVILPIAAAVAGVWLLFKIVDGGDRDAVHTRRQEAAPTQRSNGRITAMPSDPPVTVQVASVTVKRQKAKPVRHATPAPSAPESAGQYRPRIRGGAVQQPDKPRRDDVRVAVDAQRASLATPVYTDEQGKRVEAGINSAGRPYMRCGKRTAYFRNETLLRRAMSGGKWWKLP